MGGVRGWERLERPPPSAVIRGWTRDGARSRRPRSPAPRALPLPGYHLGSRAHRAQVSVYRSA